MFMQDIRQFDRAEAVLTRSPAFAAPGLSQPGIPGATPIETATGWRPAETLRPGDLVATWDGGFRALASVRAERAGPGNGGMMVRLPGGALNNCRSVWLTPAQLVLIRSPFVSAVLDAESVLLPAASLAGYRGASMVARRSTLNLVGLHFDEEELIFAASGVALYCPTVSGTVPDHSFGYLPVLDAARGRDLMALIAAGAMSSSELRRVA